MSVGAIVLCKGQELITELLKWLREPSRISVESLDTFEICAGRRIATAIGSDEISRCHRYTFALYEKSESVGHLTAEHVLRIGDRWFIQQSYDLRSTLKHDANRLSLLDLPKHRKAVGLIVRELFGDSCDLNGIREGGTPRSQTICAKVQPHQLFMASLLHLIISTHLIDGPCRSDNCKDAGDQCLPLAEVVFGCARIRDHHADEHANGHQHAGINSPTKFQEQSSRVPTGIVIAKPSFARERMH